MTGNGNFPFSFIQNLTQIENCTEIWPQIQIWEKLILKTFIPSMLSKIGFENDNSFVTTNALHMRDPFLAAQSNNLKEAPGLKHS